MLGNLSTFFLSKSGDFFSKLSFLKTFFQQYHQSVPLSIGSHSDQTRHFDDLQRKNWKL